MTTLEKLTIQFDWQQKDIEDEDGTKLFLDADIIVFMCDENRRCTRMENFVWWANPNGPQNCIVTLREEDAAVMIDFSKVPKDIKYIIPIFVVDKADLKYFNFLSIKEGQFTIRYGEDKKWVYKLWDKDYDCHNFSMRLPTLERKWNGEWCLKYDFEGMQKTLEELVQDYGLNLEEVSERYMHSPEEIYKFQSAQSEFYLDKMLKSDLKTTMEIQEFLVKSHLNFEAINDSMRRVWNKLHKGSKR